MYITIDVLIDTLHLIVVIIEVVVSAVAIGLNIKK